MYLLEGKISIKAALKANQRKINKIIIDDQKKDRDTTYIIQTAKVKQIPIVKETRANIDALCEGKTHGGIMAEVEARNFQTLEEIMENNNFIALIEGVEDPFNFGYVLRSLYAAGCASIILPQRNWTSAASTLAKSSAGASEFMKMHVSENFEDTLFLLKRENYQIVCANRDNKAIEMYDYDFNQKICICIGGEKRGLSKVILENSDQDVYIPYNTDFKNALSAASATTILAFEIMRQRKK